MNQSRQIDQKLQNSLLKHLEASPPEDYLPTPWAVPIFSKRLCHDKQAMIPSRCLNDTTVLLYSTCVPYCNLKHIFQTLSF